MNFGDGCNDEDGGKACSSAHLDLHIVSATWLFSFLFSLFTISPEKKPRRKQRKRENHHRNTHIERERERARAKK
jgi:hypothetical protein